MHPDTVSKWRSRFLKLRLEGLMDEDRPGRPATFKLSTDPLLVAGSMSPGIVGLYHDPPEKAVVLCTDETSQIQALDRSQPVLPMMPSMPERLPVTMPGAAS